MDIYAIRDECRANFNTTLRKALSFLPKMDGAHLLDAGCGTGVSTCEIARITDWHITAMDIDNNSLDMLRCKIARLGLTERIAVDCSGLEDAGLAKHCFDIILAEGLFNIIGFERGLVQCDAYLKGGGCMIIHDEMQGRKDKLRLFTQSGYCVLGEITLDEAAWGEKYCACLKAGISSVDERMMKREHERALLAQIKSELAMFEASPMVFRSIFYVVQKK